MEAKVKWTPCPRRFHPEFKLAQRMPGVAGRLRDQPTAGGDYRCTCWSKTYSGCGWAKAS